MTPDTESSPAPFRDPVAAERKAKSSLRQSVWEASQYMDYEEIRAYVESVLREIESDEP